MDGINTGYVASGAQNGIKSGGQDNHSIVEVPFDGLHYFVDDNSSFASGQQLQGVAIGLRDTDYVAE